jgi:hypothetical protein
MASYAKDVIVYIFYMPVARFHLDLFPLSASLTLTVIAHVCFLANQNADILSKLTVASEIPAS